MPAWLDAPTTRTAWRKTRFAVRKRQCKLWPGRQTGHCFAVFFLPFFFNRLRTSARATPPYPRKSCCHPSLRRGQETGSRHSKFDVASEYKSWTIQRLLRTVVTLDIPSVSAPLGIPDHVTFQTHILSYRVIHWDENWQRIARCKPLSSPAMLTETVAFQHNTNVPKQPSDGSSPASTFCVLPLTLP